MKRFLVASTVTCFFLVGCNELDDYYKQKQFNEALAKKEALANKEALAKNEAPAEEVVEVINKVNKIYKFIQGNNSDVDNGQTSDYSD